MLRLLKPFKFKEGKKVVERPIGYEFEAENADAWLSGGVAEEVKEPKKPKEAKEK